MEFAEEVYVGRSIIDADTVVQLLKRGCIAYGVFCVCTKKNGKFLYEVMSCRELLKERNNTSEYTVRGIAAGKSEAFEVVRTMVEDCHDFV